MYYNFEKLMEYNPFTYESFINSKGQTIDFIEHPIKGDLAEVIVVCKELNKACDSGFFETDDMLASHREYEPTFKEGKLFIGNSEV